METLGSLCDKLSIVKLKEYHSEDADRLKNLSLQTQQLQEEINQFVVDAMAGNIPVEKLTFAANKVFKKEGNPVAEIKGTFGEVCAQLANANCKVWHVQEHVYEFEKVPANEKDGVIKQLAILNLERTRCIDEIDRQFRDAVSSSRQNKTAG